MKNPLIALTLGALLGLAAPTGRADVILSDDFSYADGSLVTVSASKWSTHSGTAGQVDVAGGVINLTQAEGEDVNATLTGSPYTSGNLYAAFKVNFSVLPTGTGTYFAHFKDTGTSNFRARIFASTNGAAAGAFRLGITSAGSTPNLVNQDLALGTAYMVVVRLDAGTMASSLWINPATETDPSTDATDVGGVLAISTFAFRQSGNATASMGVLTVDDLVVGTTFADVLAPLAPTAPTITQQPQPQTVLEGASVSFKVVAAGSAPFTYQWRKNTQPIANATSDTYSINATTLGDSGSYDVVVTNGGGSATSDAATLTVNAVVIAPTITTDLTPATQTVNPGASVSYSVTVSGTSPFTYQWFQDGTQLSGQSESTLNLNAVTTTNAGRYKVVVSNSAGSATSAEVQLKVELPPPLTIAALRATLDPVNFVPTNTTTLYTVEGTVTTHVNLTGPGANVLFYMQDDTAGIAVFWTGGSSSFIPNAGDRVRVTGPLTTFNGLLEMGPNFSNSAHSVTRLGQNHPLPAPIVLDLNWQIDPVIMERYEGSYVVVSNVMVDLSSGPAFASGKTNGITDAGGLTFAMFADARTDVVGQAKPTTPVTILGVLGQFDSSNPRSDFYQIIPTRFADIISASKAPTIRFTNVLELIRQGDLPTNSYPDLVLQPGEKVTITANITDPDNLTVDLSAPTAGLPASAHWALSAASGTNLTAVFEFRASAAEAGQLIPAKLVAANANATNETIWKIYVPTAIEQKVTITEFLANPATTNSAPHFNPLHRALGDPVPSDYAASSYDEYVELVNLSGTDLDLAGWTISDSAALRHKFYDTFLLSAQSAAIVYGGPLNGYEPVLDVRSTPASENQFGFGLNNSGGDSIIVRNAEGNLICRVVYTDATLSAKSSATRFPDSNGVFLPQAWVSSLPASPGLQFDGSLWSLPSPQQVSQGPISVAKQADGSVTLNWTAVPGAFYTLWQTDELGVPFRPTFYGLTFSTTAGTYQDKTAASAAKRFYWISKP